MKTVASELFEIQTATSISTSSKLSFHSASKSVIQIPSAFSGQNGENDRKFKESVCNTVCFFKLEILLVG